MHFQALWGSDGTSTGTVKVYSFAKAPATSNGTVFFGSGGTHLRKVDSAGTGTVLVKDFGPGNVVPDQLTDVGGTLFFVGSDWSSQKSGHGIELWKSDGTTRGTKLVQDIYTGTTRKCYRDEDSGRRVCQKWVNSSNPADLVAVNDTLFFTADDGTRRTFSSWNFASFEGSVVRHLPRRG